MNIYLAAPLFNPREREFNLALTKRLEEFATVFLPQRDGLLLADIIAGGMSPEDAEKEVYEKDVSAMRTSDIIVAMLDGASVDDGVAFELGYMRALGKRAVALQSDVRRQLPSGNNPMISQGLDAVFSDIEALISWVRQASD